MSQKLSYLTLLLFLVLSGCENSKKSDDTSKIEKAIAEVQQEFVPDSRVALFDVEVQNNNNNNNNNNKNNNNNNNNSVQVLKGETNLPQAATSLKDKLKSEQIKFVDSIRLLPDTEGLDGKIFGVIKISVANLRDAPNHPAQLTTQATLGTPVKIYKKRGSWYYIQTPDNYLAWVDSGGVEAKSEEGFETWKSSEKLIFLETYGQSFKASDIDSQPVSDLVSGNVLELVGEQNGFYEVKYPDGKKAFVEKAKAKEYAQWLASLDQTKEDLVQTSKDLMGLPYLWGGTSPKGVDCSGFTKTIYFLNGMVLPRDASQQIETGIMVDSTKNFENLIPGDLLFFGKPATDSTKERIIHVGMWIGNDQFIHSMGEVHISTVDTTAADFDRYNYNRYLRTKRVLNADSTGITYLTRKDIFTKDTISEGAAEE